jgi:hypothetical protein
MKRLSGETRQIDREVLDSLCPRLLVAARLIVVAMAVPVDI